MRFSAAISLALVSMALLTPRLPAQSKGAVQITAVRVGFLPGPLLDKDDLYRRGPMSKAGQWTPVYVTVEGRQPIKDAVLIVQSIDSADDQNGYPVKVPLVEFTAEAPSHTFVTYTRPGKVDNAVTA